MYLRNCWYVIAWDHEVPPGGLFARTVLNEPILVFRGADGSYAALEDRCCHRHAPLSKGRNEGDGVRCGYHGLKFDALGRCVDAPGLDRIPPQAKVKTYPVAVRNKWVFVWMGDPAQANERGKASWYGPGFSGHRTACGHLYNEWAFTAAHPHLPCGTRVRVIRLDTMQQVDVTIDDRGPYAKGRIIDLSRGAANVLRMVKAGTVNVLVVPFKGTPK